MTYQGYLYAGTSSITVVPLPSNHPLRLGRFPIQPPENWVGTIDIQDRAPRQKEAKTALL